MADAQPLEEIEIELLDDLNRVPIKLRWGILIRRHSNGKRQHTKKDNEPVRIAVWYDYI